MKKCFIKKNLFCEKLKAVLLVAFQSCFLAGITVFAVMPTGCKLAGAKSEQLEGDFKAPVIEKILVIDEKTLEIDFSEGVLVEAGSITNEAVNKLLGSEISYSDDSKKVIVSLTEEMNSGDNYVFSGIVDDKNGNSLTFAIPFTGFNSNVPEIIITEIQTESLSQNTTEKKNGTYRSEFVEFLALSDGNLSGLELVSANDGEDRRFVFPKIDVKAGDVFVLHLRKRGEGCISETEDDLNLAYGGYSKAGIRDLWCESESTALGNDTDVIILKNSADASVLDCTVFRSSEVSEWAEKFVKYVDLLVEAGFLESSDANLAVLTDNMTASKTLNRVNVQEILNKAGAGEDFSYPIKFTKDDWTITSSSSGVIEP